MGDARVGRIVGWTTVAVAAALVVAFFAFVLQGASCADAVDGDSVCGPTGPAVGTGGVWTIGITGAVVILLAIWRVTVAVRTTAGPAAGGAPGPGR